MRLRPGTLVTVALSASVVGLGSLALVRTVDEATSPRGGVAPTSTPRHLAIGVSTLSLARNATDPWEPADLEEVDDFERRAGVHAGIVMWFADFAGAGFDPRQARAVARRGSVPEISWEPWDAASAKINQPTYRLKTIIDGSHDAVIRGWARGIAAYGAPVRLRFGHEMNGRWYPWAELANGNRPGEFVQAWRHVREIFAAEGASNVSWIWAPVAGTVTRELFPGEAAVDEVGVSGFNGGARLFRREWRPFETAFGPTLTAVHAMAPSKPVTLPEIASANAGGDKAEWIRELFAAVASRPYIRSLVWFNLVKETDWRIESSAAAQAAFAQGAAASATTPPGTTTPPAP